MIRSKLTFTLRSLRERLWIKPLGYAVLAVAAVFVARLADLLPFADALPEIEADTVERLLSVISASMLGVATFAVASMVSAYASASGSATPRAFVLLVADGLSQTALSSFIGAFIFSIVGIIAVRIGYFGPAGHVAMFLFTLGVLAFVILTFVRWVDTIARLGRMPNTIDKVESATRDAFAHWTPGAPLSARPGPADPPAGAGIFPDRTGFVQHVDIACLQDWAESRGATIHLRARPGALVTDRRPLLTVIGEPAPDETDRATLRDAFVIGDRRSYAVDPRFGLIALSEIGSRALSPGVNDPGTAIEIVVRLARILRDWSLSEPPEDGAPACDRVHVPPLDPGNLLDDAFAAIVKDGVGSVEVGIWIQKSLGLLAAEAAPEIGRAAARTAEQALARAERALDFGPDLDRVRRAHRTYVAGAD